MYFIAAAYRISEQSILPDYYKRLQVVNLRPNLAMTLALDIAATIQQAGGA